MDLFAWEGMSFLARSDALIPPCSSSYSGTGGGPPADAGGAVLPAAVLHALSWRSLRMTKSDRGGVPRRVLDEEQTWYGLERIAVGAFDAMGCKWRRSRRSRIDYRCRWPQLPEKDTARAFQALFCEYRAAIEGATECIRLRACGDGIALRGGRPVTVPGPAG